MDAENPDPAREPPGLPRWLKVSMLVSALLVLLLLVVMLLLGGEHGPSRHASGML